MLRGVESITAFSRRDEIKSRRRLERLEKRELVDVLKLVGLMNRKENLCLD